MPTYSRRKIFNPNTVGFYHCFNKIVRCSFLCGRDKGSGQTLDTSNFNSIQKRIHNFYKGAFFSYGFLALFKECYDILHDEEPFLLIDEKDYIDICLWYAGRKPREATKLRQFGLVVDYPGDIRQIMQSSNYIIGDPCSVTEWAASAGWSWFQDRTGSRNKFFC